MHSTNVESQAQAWEAQLINQSGVKRWGQKDGDLKLANSASAMKPLSCRQRSTLRTMALPLRGKLRVGLLALGFMSIVSFLYMNGISSPWMKNTRSDSLDRERRVMWQELQPLLEKFHPNCPSPTRQESAGMVSFEAIAPQERPDLVDLPETSRKSMEWAHRAFVEAVRRSPVLAGGGAYVPSTSGLVSTAGNSYLPLYVMSLRMLRRTGSTLPAELFLRDSSEYESKICEEVLPSLNARCIILTDIMRTTRFGSPMVIAHFQLKVFAVLFSSFENILWTDSDCFPLHDPAVLFSSDPFASKGLVMWPDFWSSTASPLYYNVSAQPVPPMDARQSSETGAFMVSKKTHLLPLALAAYYNYYGPSHYFMLLSQGAPGEGDKETFLQAATAVGAGFYTVSERVAAIGHVKSSTRGGLSAAGGAKISGSAMIQSDPIEDFNLTSQDKWRVKNESVAEPPRVSFIHAHYPKFNPAENLFGYQWETTPTLKEDGTFGRAWVAPVKELRRFGYDAERAYWEEIKWVSCNLEEDFTNWAEVSGICQQVQFYWEDVFENANDDVPRFTQD